MSYEQVEIFKMNLIGQVLQDRYRIIRQIGEGGMGRVYFAEDARLNQFVAVKETLSLRGNESSEHIASLIKAFQREAHLLAGQIKHPSIPKVIDYFQFGENWYIVMEYIDGDSLEQQRNKRGGPFSAGEVLGWTDQLLKILELLHNQNPPIIHRDIKPDNIKVKNNTLYLLDFGLAKQLTGSQSTNTAYATPSFSSPEQLENRDVTGKSDLYSVGATMYCLLTNIEPVGAFERSLAIAVGKPDPLRHIKEFRPDLSDAAAGLIMSAMAVNPEQRPSSAELMRLKLNDSAVPESAETVSYAPHPSAARSENTIPYIPYRSAPTEVLPTSPASPITAETLPAKRSKLPLIIAAIGLFLFVSVAVVGFAAYQIGGRFLSSAGPSFFANPREKSVALTEQAMEKFYVNDYPQAKSLSQAAVNADPTYPLAHAIYGDAFWDTEQVEELGSANSETQIHKAKIIEIFKDREPVTAEDYAARAWALTVDRKWIEGQQDIEKAAALKPEWAWALQQRAFILSRETIFCESEKPPVESKIAIDMFKQVNALKPSFATAYNNLALIYKCGGQEKEAIDYSTKAVNFWQSPKTYTVRGFFHLSSQSKDRKDALEKARRDFVKAVEIDPQYSDAHRGLATVYDNNLEFDKCIDEVKLSLKNKEYPESYYLWASCRLSLAKQEKDEEGYREALEKNEKAIEQTKYSNLSFRDRSLAKFYASKANIQFAKAAYIFTEKYAKSRSSADKAEIKTELENARISISEAIRINQDKRNEGEYQKIKNGVEKILRTLK